MFKKTITGISIVIMSVSMAACDVAEGKPEGTYIEQIEAAGLPTLPATDDEIHDIGHEMCMLRGEGASKDDIVDLQTFGPLDYYYDEDQLREFNDIMYANLCPEFR